MFIYSAFYLDLIQAEIEMSKRKSMSARDVPRAGDIQLLEQIRTRTQRTLKAAISAVLKLSAEDNLSNLLIMRDDLADKWSNFSDAFEELEAALVGAGEIAKVDQITVEYNTYNTSFLKAKMFVSALICDQQDEADVSNAGHPTADHTQAQPRSSIKMAPTRITPFSGNVVDWIEFKATCKAVLLDHMSDIERLQHLKDALLGEARALVSHILPTNGAYDEAMKLLQDRYENTRAIVNTQLKKLYAIPTIESPSSGAFRAMRNVINGVITTLSSCSIDTTSWDAILIFHVTQRFDKATLALWEEKLDGKRTIPAMKIFEKFLETRITVLESTETTSVPTQLTQSERSAKPFTKPQSAHKPTYEHKRSGEKVKSFLTLKSTYQCAFCSENHLPIPSRCNKILNMKVKDRQTLIRKNNLCQNCFYNHHVDACPFEPACKKCDESHNTLLHVNSNQTFLTNTVEESSIEQAPLEQENHDDSDSLSIASEQHILSYQ